MGSVYRAYDAELGRDVALKRVHPGSVSVTAARERLAREALAMARVEHPAVVRLYDAAVYRGELFVAMELARGGTLAAWMTAAPRRWSDVLRLFVEAGRGIAAAHRAGLVHRDIKPSNILLDGRGCAQISDFGLARTLADTHEEYGTDAVATALVATITRQGTIAGTLPYMAPEQLTGRPVDARADQFGFCVALWEALCGQRPFQVEANRSPEAFMEAIHRGPVDSVRDARRVPLRLLAVVRRGMAEDREQRWASMGALLDALERAARPPRRRWLAAAAAIVLGGSSIAAGFGLGSEHIATVPCGKRAQVLAIWNVAARSTYLSTAASSDGNEPEDARWFDFYSRAIEIEYEKTCVNGDAQRIACLDGAVEDLRAAVARSDRRYWPRLRALDLCGKTWREHAVGNLGADEFAQLSPNGHQLLVRSRHAKPSVQDLQTNRRQPLDLARALRWLDDGSIAGHDENGELVVVESSNGHAIREFHVTGRPIDVSPNLRYVATIADDTLSIVPLGGDAHLAYPSPSPWGSWQGKFSPNERWFAELTPPFLYIDDLVSRHHELIVLRLSTDATSSGFRITWLDANSIVLSGGSTRDLSGDVWRIRIDPEGRLAGPPEILQLGEPSAFMVADDASNGMLLVERGALTARGLVVENGTSTLLPGSLPWLQPAAADRTRRRALVATEPSRSHWAWMSLDGSTMEPIAALDGQTTVVESPTGFAALDLRGEPPVYIAFDEAGAELARVPIEKANSQTATLRCSAASCFVRWLVGSERSAYMATIVGNTISAPVRHDESGDAWSVPWDVTPNGEQIAVTIARSDRILLYDLQRKVAQVVSSECCESINDVWFARDGNLVMSGFQRSNTDRRYVLVKRDISGHEQALWRSDFPITGFVEIDNHRIILSTLAPDPKRLALLTLQ